MNAAYIDASALVKLFKAESETVALRTPLSDWPVQVASELIRVEAIPSVPHGVLEAKTSWRAQRKQSSRST